VRPGAKEGAIPETAMDDSPDSDANIEIRLGRPQQLFNSFDPSPFHERDLDEDAEACIVDSVDEFPLQKRLRLIIHLPADQLPAGNVPDLPQAIHNYFAYRLHESRRRLRLFFREGRIALLIGLAFLFAASYCVSSPLRLGEAPSRRSPRKACSLSAGSQCGGHWRSFCTTGGRSGAAVRYSPSSPISP
jgi:hypothetical protein